MPHFHQNTSPHERLTMPRIKRNDFTDTQLREAYEQAGNLSDMAKSLGISYPTAWDWAREIGIKTKRRGYTAPPVPISGAQCRYAREYLEMTAMTSARPAVPARRLSGNSSWDNQLPVGVRWKRS